MYTSAGILPPIYHTKSSTYRSYWQPVFICIDHRIISCILNPLTERVDHVADLRLRQGSQRISILGIKDNREGDRIILDKIQDKIRLLLRHFDRSRIRINVRAQPQPCLARICRVHSEKRIHITAEPGCQHRKLYIIRCHLAPIYILLPVRYIHAARNRTDPLILRHPVHAKPRCDRAHTPIRNRSRTARAACTSRIGAARTAARPRIRG